MKCYKLIGSHPTIEMGAFSEHVFELRYAPNFGSFSHPKSGAWRAPVHTTKPETAEVDPAGATHSRSTKR